MAGKTPSEKGYTLPAEWEPHEGTWLQWPQNKIYSRYELKLEGIWLNMVDALHEHENVHQTTQMTIWHMNTLTDAAYSNYLVANELVLVPVFGQKNDDRAMKIIAEHFPGRQFIGIEVVGLINHGGAIGCVTQPQPAARETKGY